MLNHTGTRSLETDRLILRRHKLTDADDMYQNWVTDPKVCQFWNWKPHKSIAETKGLLAEWIKEYNKPDYYHWIIILKELSQAIGYIYFTDIDNTNNSLSVHYALSQIYWKQGIMTEACKCVLRFAFEVLGIQQVHSTHHIDNPASGRLLQKAGMRYIKTEYTQIPDCDRLSSEYCFYEITASD